MRSNGLDTTNAGHSREKGSTCQRGVPSRRAVVSIGECKDLGTCNGTVPVAVGSVVFTSRGMEDCRRSDEDSVREASGFCIRPLDEVQVLPVRSPEDGSAVPTSSPCPKSPRRSTGCFSGRLGLQPRMACVDPRKSATDNARD